MDYFVHDTAVVDDGAIISKGVKIWHFSHVMSDSVIGEGCNLGQNVVIHPGVVLGGEMLRCKTMFQFILVLYVMTMFL